MKTVVYGLGKSSISVLKHLSSISAVDVAVVNRGDVSLWQNLVKDIDKSFSCFSEEDSNEVFKNAQRIIISPGIPRDVHYLKGVDPTIIIGEIEYAYLNSTVPVIAVTGSNGKTTTSTMIKESLEAFGLKVFLGGNIGIPYTDILAEKYDFAVIEVSSFQLESINKFTPNISIITNITPNHMERYSSFEDYKMAKLNIFKNQTTGLLISSESSYAPDHLDLKLIKELEGFNLNSSNIVGDHNLLNLFCANEVCKELCSNYSREVFQSFINSFKAPAFRLQYITEKCNLRFFNDSKSTNLESTLKAVSSFDKGLNLIVGGKLRSSDISDYKELSNYNINKIYAFGEAAQKLSNIIDCIECTDLVEVFKKLKDISKGVVLFSPGFPSFDQYKNFEERGEHYNSLIDSFTA